MKHSVGLYKAIDPNRANIELLNSDTYEWRFAGTELSFTPLEAHKHVVASMLDAEFVFDSPIKLGWYRSLETNRKFRIIKVDSSKFLWSYENEAIIYEGLVSPSLDGFKDKYVFLDNDSTHSCDDHKTLYEGITQRWHYCSVCDKRL